MFSIIIVNYKTWHFIERNLVNLLESFPNNISKDIWPFEVIVADNSPDDEGRKSFQDKFPQVKIIKTKGNYGYSYACNKGASVANGRSLLFMNPDIICDWDNLQQFVKGAEKNTKWQIFSAPQYGVNPRRLQRTFAPFTNLLTYYPTMRILLRLFASSKYQDPRTNPEKFKDILEVDWVSGSLLLISRSSFDKINGWDEDFWLYREDEDICRRAHKLGIKTAYYPFVSFVHSHASSTRSNLETKVLTKSETIVSTYLYLFKHNNNKSNAILRFLLRLRTAIFYPLLEIIGAITFKSITALEQKRLIHKRLWHYFKRVKKTGNAISELSVSYTKN